MSESGHGSQDQGLRERLIEAARALNQSGLNVGSSGNLSVRVSGGMRITPSGVPYSALSREQIAHVDVAGRWDERARPSSEWRIHRDIYASRPEVGAIVHAHPPWSTTLACLRRHIPAFHYEVAFGGGHDIRCADYATFGTQALSDNVIRALTDRRTCLMANHGLICLGADLDGAMGLTRDVEFLARVYCQALAIGEPALLDEGEMARNLALFADYGIR